MTVLSVNINKVATLRNSRGGDVPNLLKVAKDCERFGAEGITVNCICPGPINTAMTAAIPKEDKQIYSRRRVPLKRYGEPEEVAHMTLSLCLPAASFVNGAVLPVDGGLSIKRA